MTRDMEWGLPSDPPSECDNLEPPLTKISPKDYDDIVLSPLRAKNSYREVSG